MQTIGGWQIRQRSRLPQQHVPHRVPGTMTPPVAGCLNWGVILSVSAWSAGAGAGRANLIVAAGEATDG
jgi:hypothetical protein